MNLGSLVTFSRWSYYWPFNKSAAFPPLLCVLHHTRFLFFFYFICGIFMKREMKGGGSLVLCSHIYPLQRLWTGARCLLWFYVGYTLSSKVGGQEASLSCRQSYPALCSLYPDTEGGSLKAVWSLIPPLDQTFDIHSSGSSKPPSPRCVWSWRDRTRLSSVLMYNSSLWQYQLFYVPCLISSPSAGFKMTY